MSWFRLNKNHHCLEVAVLSTLFHKQLARDDDLFSVLSIGATFLISAGKYLEGSLGFHHSCCSVAQSCSVLCNPMDCSMLGFPVLHYFPEFARNHVLWVDDGQGSLACCSPWGCKESDTIERLNWTGLYPLNTNSISPRCNNQKCLLMLPDAPGRNKNHTWLRITAVEGKNREPMSDED